MLAVHAVGGGDDHHRDGPQHADPLGGVRADRLAAVAQSTAGRSQQQVGVAAGVQPQSGVPLDASVMDCDGAELSDAAVHADPLGGVLADRLAVVAQANRSHPTAGRGGAC